MTASSDTLLLYGMGKGSSVNIRLPMEMKDVVDGKVLESAVNNAIKRYPYFKRKLELNADGEYLLVDSDEPVVVTKTSSNNPVLGSKETNGYLIAVDYTENWIYFNISHTLTNGMGLFNWALTTVYEYVTEKENVVLNCPNIRKPDSPLLDGECAEITEEMLPEDNEPLWKGFNKKIHTYTLLRGYIRCMLQPKSIDNYYLITIDEKELMQYITSNDGSPATFFSVMMFRAADKWMPAKYKDIEIGNYICTASILKLPNTHQDSSMSISTRYKREMAKWSTEKLCTMTRGNLFLQTDESVVIQYWKKMLALKKQMQQTKGIKNKRKLCSSSKLLHTSQILSKTASVSYMGRYSLGDLSAYIKSITMVGNGEGMVGIMAIDGKFCITFMQKDKKERWLKSFLSVLDDEHVKYTIEGVYDKNMSKGTLLF